MLCVAAVLLGGFAAPAGAIAAAGAGAAAGRGAAAGTGAARIVGEQRIGPRVIHLRIATTAFTAATDVDVDLPVGYDSRPKRRWPVTYYVAGTSHHYGDFNNEYAGLALTQHFPSIIVSPNGNSGYWSDWYNGGAFGPPKYETFVIDQLIGLIDRAFRTIPSGSERAVMGESMGGYGAMMYAAEHPDLFTAASSLSGAVDTNFEPGAAVLSGSSTLDGAPPDAIYGPQATQEVRWHGHDPFDLAENLRDVDLQIRAANGSPDPGDTSPGDAASCVIQQGVYVESTDFHDQLDSLGIRNLWRDDGTGCHTVRVFEHEISDTLPVFERAFKRGRPAPRSFTYTSIQPRFEIWGWRIAADPARALEFLTIRNAGRSGVTLIGSGRTTVTTAPLFRGVRAVIVRIGRQRLLERPDRAGRIRFSVSLGAPDLSQEYTAGANTVLTSRTVSFSPRAWIVIARTP